LYLWLCFKSPVSSDCRLKEASSGLIALDCAWFIASFDLGHELCRIMAVRLRLSFWVSDSMSWGLMPSSKSSLQMSEAGEELSMEK